MGKQDSTVRWPKDSTTLNIGDEKELRFWANRFHVGREMLKRAVWAVGPKFKDVSHYLNYKRGNVLR
jgi:hypothetical protein